MELKKHTLTWLLRGLVLLTIGFSLLRFVNLKADTPLQYSGYGTSELSDPYMYTSFSRNRVLFGDSNPSGYERWKIWQHSLIAGMSYLMFSLGGVSRFTANLSGALLQLGGFFLFLLAWRTRTSFLEVALVGLFLVTCNGLFFSGRAPFHETSIVFLFGLSTYIYFRFGQTTPGLALTGILVAATMFLGKLTGAAILAPILIDCLFDGYKTGFKKGGIVLAGVAGGTVLYALLFFNGSVFALLDYYRTLTSAVGLTPNIPMTFNGWYQMLFTYGQTGLFRFHPIFALLSVLGIIQVILSAVAHEGGILKADKRKRAMIFFVIWALVGVAMLLPYQYRPYRYYLPYFLPLAALSASVLVSCLSAKISIALPKKHLWFTMTTIALGCTYLFSQSAIAWNNSFVKETASFQRAETYYLLIGITISILVFLITRARKLVIPLAIGRAVGGLAIAVFLTVNTYLILGNVFFAPAALNRQVNDLEGLLGDKVVIAGLFAPAFSIGTSYRNIIFPLSVASKDKEFLREQAVTHIVGYESVIQNATKQFKLTDTMTVAKIWAREARYIVSKINNPNYRPSDFELAVDFHNRKILDSALFYLNKILTKLPKNIDVRLEYATVLAEMGRAPEALSVTQSLTEEFADFHFIHNSAGWIYFALARQTGQRALFVQTRNEFQLAADLNPPLAKRLNLNKQVQLIDNVLRGK